MNDALRDEALVITGLLRICFENLTNFLTTNTLTKRVLASFERQILYNKTRKIDKDLSMQYNKPKIAIDRNFTLQFEVRKILSFTKEVNRS